MNIKLDDVIVDAEPMRYDKGYRTMCCYQT